MGSLRDVPVFSPPDITDKEIDEVVDTLKSGWLTTGPKTKKFEQKIAEFCHTSKAVCLNSATACMELTLRILGVGPGDEVITTAYTYTATCSVICHVGATPILIDVAKDSFEIDYDALGEAITERTKVIMPVDLAGMMCDYDRLFAIVNEKKKCFKPANAIQKAYNRIVILADSAHGFGATFHGKMSGEVADFTSFSFHAVKNLTTGEGGAVVWRSQEGISDEWLYKEFQLLSLHGQSKDALAKTQLGSWEYDIMEQYYKCNMTDIMASIGLAQLERYPELLQRREQIIQWYEEGLKGLDLSIFQHEDANRISSKHLFLIRLNHKNREYCNYVMEEMAKRGIPTNVHYKPLPLLHAYKGRGFNMIDYPHSYEVFQNLISLPLHTKLTKEQVDWITSSLQDIMNQ